MNARKQLVCRRTRVLDDPPVEHHPDLLGEVVVQPVAICAQDRSWRDVGLREGQGIELPPRAIDDRDTNASQSSNVIGVVFDRDHDFGFVVVARRVHSRRSATDEGAVHLDDPAWPPEHLAIWAHHGSAQLVHPGPRRLVGGKAEDPLEAQSGNTVLLAQTNHMAANQVRSGRCER